ncbi:MAG: cbb3-type cytochrome c oxidase subunit I [Nitrospinota bacterium]|jgi:cbb3-type cytochrome oxidase subunit 1
MFSLVRRYVKTSLFFFLTGLMVGMWILIDQFIGERGTPAILISVHTHLILFGFVIMLIMGIAYWMFPRPAREDTRYSPSLAEINYWLITIGTSVRTAGELGLSFTYSLTSWLVLIGGASLQILAGIIFAWNIWSRIRAVGSQFREVKGERF